jgi:AraC-like DNA-binding protein
MNSEPDYFSLQTSQARRFYLNLNPSQASPLAVVSGGCEHCRPDYRIQRPGLRYFSIEFVAAGAGTLTLKGKDHQLAVGDIFAYGPRIPHDIQCDPDRPLVKYFVDFVGKKARQLLAPPAPPPGTLVQTSNPQDIRRLFEDLITAGLRSTRFRSRICSTVVEQMLLRIAETAVAPGTVGTAAFESYRRCHQFITDHYLELFSLAEIADQCHLDSAYLCRLFSRFDDESPYEYLTRLKMMHAADLLQIPGILVKQVATQLGFEDQFRFSRTFTRVLAMSPREFATLAQRGQAAT